MKRIIGLFFIALFVAVAGYNAYLSKKTNGLSDLVIANVEALADGAEIDGTNCDASWNQECCVCFTRHHIYAYPRTDTGACEHRTDCSHY